MKTLKLAVAAVILTLGVGTAVIQKVHAAPKAQDITYDWTSPDQGNFTGTRDAAVDHYGCNTGSQLCASGSAQGQPDVELDKN